MNIEKLNLNKFVTSRGIAGYSGRLGEQTGSASQAGKVYKLGTDDRFVVKIIKIDNSVDLTPDFDNEVSVGRIRGIEKVGVRIYTSFREYKNGKFFGAYIMDSLLGGRDSRTYEAVPLSDVLKEINLPLNNSQVIEFKKTDDTFKFIETFIKLLFNFYQITEGWHGDLHNRNIQVVRQKGAGLKIIKMAIIDYATHVPFKRSIRSKKLSDLGEIFEQINSEFEHMSPFRNVQQQVEPNRKILLKEKNPMLKYAEKMGLYKPFESKQNREWREKRERERYEPTVEQVERNKKKRENLIKQMENKKKAADVWARFGVPT